MCSVSFTWDPNSESDLAGYEIYYGTEAGNYQWNIDVGNVTNYSVNGLDTGMTYILSQPLIIPVDFKAVTPMRWFIRPPLYLLHIAFKCLLSRFRRIRKCTCHDPGRV